VWSSTSATPRMEEWVSNYRCCLVRANSGGVDPAWEWAVQGKWIARRYVDSIGSSGGWVMWRLHLRNKVADILEPWFCYPSRRRVAGERTRLHDVPLSLYRRNCYWFIRWVSRQLHLVTKPFTYSLRIQTARSQPFPAEQSCSTNNRARNSYPV